MPHRLVLSVVQVSSSYRHLKSECDGGGDPAVEAGRSAEASKNLVLETKGAEAQRRPYTDGGKEGHTYGDHEKRKSPSGESWMKIVVVVMVMV